MTYLSEEIESRSLGLAMGLYVSGTAFGGMAGRLLTGVISDLSSWRIAVFSMGGLGLVASTIFWYALPASKHFVPHPLRIRSALIYLDVGSKLRYIVPHLDSLPSLPIVLVLRRRSSSSRIQPQGQVKY